MSLCTLVFVAIGLAGGFWFLTRRRRRAEGYARFDERRGEGQVGLELTTVMQAAAAVVDAARGRGEAHQGTEERSPDDLEQIVEE